MARRSRFELIIQRPIKLRIILEIDRDVDISFFQSFPRL